MVLLLQKKKTYALVSTIDPPEENITSANCPRCSFNPNTRAFSEYICGKDITLECRKMGSYYWENFTNIKKIKIL